MVESVFDNFEKWINKYRKVFNPDEEVDTRQILDSFTYNKAIVPRYHYDTALISNEVYNKPEDRKLKIDILELDERFNTIRTCCYKSKEENFFIIGVRGTSTSLLDLGTDILIATGKSNLSLRKSEQYKFVKQIIDTLKREGYNIRKSYITGHSLGGLLTVHLIELIPEILGVGWNIGSSPTQTKAFSNYLFNKPILNNINDALRYTNYFMKGDLISISSKYLYKDSIEINPTPPASGPIEAHKMTFMIKNIRPYPDIIET